jgi:hypothetical protein
MKLIVDFSQLDYMYSRNQLEHSLALIATALRGMVDVTPTIPPFRYRKKRLFSSMTYDELGKTIRFDDDSANIILEYHKKRLALQSTLSTMLYFAVAIIGSVILLVSFGYIAPIFGNRGIILNNFSSFITLTLAFISSFLAMRIAVLLVDKHFADTLSIVCTIYLNIYLEKEQTLSDPEARRRILDRIRILRKNIILLARTFADGTDLWPYQHMKHIENFVREREHWIIAPQKQTLEDLRKDFSYLLEILVTGEYGNFQWEKDEKVTEVQKQKPSEGFINKSVRFLLMIFPFILLIILYLSPDRITALGIDTNTVFLVSLAWILLIIDANLNLGIIERVTGLAKTMKDLR